MDMNYKHGDYVMYLDKTVAKVILHMNNATRVRVLHSTQSNLTKGDRILVGTCHLTPLDPHVGQILDD